MSLFPYYSPLEVHLSRTIPSGDKGGAFLHVSNTEPLQNAGKLMSKSPRNSQISYGHPHAMAQKGRISRATATTSLDSQSQTHTT